MHALDEKPGKGPKFYVNIEGTEYPWDENTITTEQIAGLGGWDPSVGVIEIDADNNERTLRAGEVVELKPGHGFAKKIRWRRGQLPEERMNAELDILRRSFPGFEYVTLGHWIRIPDYLLPPGWNRQRTEVAFQIPYPGYPGAHPYGIYVPAGILFGGGSPRNYTEPAANKPPFAGVWGVFSWQPEKWTPAANITAGSNLWTWVKSFSVRFREGL